MGSIRFLGRVAGAAVMLVAVQAHAQQTPFNLPVPYDGAYFDPAQPGIGLWLDNGPDGTTFGALMYYAPDGRPTFSTFASRFSTVGSLAEAFSAVRGLRGPLHESVDGQCPGCPYRAPVSRPLAGDFLTEIAHRAARVTVGGSRFQMGAIPFGRSDPALLEGTWWLSLDDVEAPTPGGASLREGSELQAVVRIVPVSGVRFVPSPMPYSELDYRYVDANSVVHEVHCVTSCGDFESWRLRTGPSTRVFAHGRASTSQFMHAAFGRYVETPDGYAMPNDSWVHAIKPDPWRVHSILTANFAPRLALLRSPIAAPCDGDVLCRETRTQPGAREPLPYDSGDPYARVVRGLTGAWYDPQQSGTGLWIDAGRDGNTFMTLMTYAPRADGGSDPVFYTLGGPIEMLARDDFITFPGVRSPLYESRDGQPLGGTWRAPTTGVATEFGTASVTFGGHRVVLDVAGTTYAMVPLVADRAFADLPSGRWLLTLRDQLEYAHVNSLPANEPFALIEALSAEVEIVPTSLATGTIPAGQLRPHPAARTFLMRCLASCTDFDAWRRGLQVGLWIDHADIAVMSLLDGNLSTFAGARQYLFDVDDDLLEGDALNLALPGFARSVNRGRVTLHRNPPRAFCDTDDECR